MIDAAMSRSMEEMLQRLAAEQKCDRLTAEAAAALGICSHEVDEAVKAAIRDEGTRGVVGE